VKKCEGEMKNRQFGSTSKQVSEIGQGTWNIETAVATAVAALRRGIDLGLTHIDTAELYGFGSESGFPAPRSAGGQVLQQIADAHGATPRQVALRFLLQNPCVFTIPKASTPEHVIDNAEAGKLELSAAEVERIDIAFPRGPRPRSLPMI
jgi:diketogulonate reductase-like aldo/keto reductase